METIKVYKLINLKSGKVYRYKTLMQIMKKLHLGFFMAKDFISGEINKKEYRKKLIAERLSFWWVAEDKFPAGKLVKNVDGTFRKGVSKSMGHKWKKGKNYRHAKGTRVAPQTEFKGGHTPANFKGIGTPRVLFHKGRPSVITTIKKTKRSVSRGRKYKCKRRTSYSRYVVGVDKIPAGRIVYHKDGDPLNNAPSNLRIITRAELLRINQGRRV